MTDGLLCMKCNMAIGLLSDSPAIMEQAIAYLRRSANSPARIA